MTLNKIYTVCMVYVHVMCVRVGEKERQREDMFPPSSYTVKCITLPHQTIFLYHNRNEVKRPLPRDKNSWRVSAFITRRV